MAEGLLHATLDGSVRVLSAGLDALVDAPPDPEAVRLLREQGIDIASHRGRQVTPEMACEADLILVETDKTPDPSGRQRAAPLEFTKVTAGHGEDLRPGLPFALAVDLPREVIDPMTHRGRRLAVDGVTEDGLPQGGDLT